MSSTTNGTAAAAKGFAHEPPAETSEAIGDALRESTRDTRPGPQIGSIVSDVEAERVSWLWRHRFAIGELAIVDGDPGDGKSTVLADVTARLTAGRPMPAEEGRPVPYRNGAGVVYVTVEDSISHTIRPRLEAAGAVLNRVCAVQGVPSADGGPDVVPVIPDDLHHLRKAVEDVAARLVVIDPLMAHLPGDVNSFRDQDVRAALGPLSTFAKEAGVAVVVVRHLNKKTGGPALYRGGGSIGVIGAARVGLLLGRDPEDEDRRVLAPLKNNLSRPASSLAFRLVDGGGEYDVARVEWEGEVDLSAQDLLQPPQKKDGKKEEAKDWICEKLSDGPRLAAELYDEAEAAGLKKITLKRARKEVAEAKREGFGGDGRWRWHLKERYAQKANSAKEIITDDRLSDGDAPNVSKDDRLRENAPENTPQNETKSASVASAPKKITPDDRLSDRLRDDTQKHGMKHTKGIMSGHPPRTRKDFAAGDRVDTPKGEGAVVEGLDTGRVAVKLDNGPAYDETQVFDADKIEVN